MAVGIFDDSGERGLRIRTTISIFLPQSGAASPQIKAPLVTNSTAALMEKWMESGAQPVTQPDGITDGSHVCLAEFR